jgi:DNA-directed RNA polymerase specialized sigma subunit
MGKIEVDEVRMLDGRDDRSSLDIVESEDLGLKAPRSRGSDKKKGRPKKGMDEQRLSEVVRLYFLEKLSMRQVADIVGVSHMSVYRMLSDPNLELLI